MLVTENNLAPFVDWLDRQTEIGIDTETTGLNAYAIEQGVSRICGVSVAGHDGQSFYLPFRHKIGYSMDISVLHSMFDYLNRRRDLKLLFWNAKFDLHMMSVDKYIPPRTGGIEDHMLGAHLLNENEPSFGLKQYCDKYGFGRGSLDEADLREKIEALYGATKASEWKGSIWKLDAIDVAPYAETDAVLTLAAGVAIQASLARQGLSELFDEINNYMLLVWRMESRGVQIDVERIRDQMHELGPLRDGARRRVLAHVLAMTGSTINPIPLPPAKIGKRGLPLKQKPREEFNPASPDQVAYLTDWPTTDVKYIEELADDDPLKQFGEDLLDFRVLSKMTGTYYDAYLDLVDANGILRGNYNLHGTVNGRASSSNPNLQNVPRWTPRRPVKEVFIPRAGYMFLEMDYQQAELRIATHYANCERMRAIFNAGGDPHGETAKLQNIPRFVAKTLNFLIIYGGGVNAIMRTLKCDETTARNYLDGYHALYPEFRAFSNACANAARRDGYIQMPTGRIRHFNTWKRHSWEAEPRKAMNSFVQGTAAEMLRVGLERFDDGIAAEQLDAYPLLQTHDSLLVEVRPDDAVRCVALMRETLTDFQFDPAPAIDVKYGMKWAPMEAVPEGF